jgi:hypothetical protein
MRGAVITIILLLATVLAGCIEADPQTPPGPQEHPLDRPVTVIALVDSAFNPYHWDFLAEHMPQQNDGDPTTDLPLDQDPSEWIPGFPASDAFDSYTRLDLTLTPDDPDAVPEDLHETDKTQWDQVKRSTRDEVHMHWIPGTKVIGYVNFGSGDGFAPSSHGTGVSSVSAGNLHGTCPECLIVFVNGFSEAANEWVLQQDWIDVQSNSWGISITPASRDRLYAGSDTELQREGSQRGQAVFFSAGNGQANTFTAPNPTLWSSQEGPDWIFTVGAIDPDGHRSYSGHGKPADISSIGLSYPSMGGGTVTAESTFGGTSNATPVTAGIYARALWLLRQDMMAERTQQEGTLATKDPSAETTCGSANPDCALADGVLRVEQLREALFRSAEYRTEGWAVTLEGIPVPVETDEMRLVAEGHGSFLGRMADDWQAESQHVADYVRGNWYEEQDQDQYDWMVALSWCRQNLWGEWDHGYWNPDVELPASDPENWPLRTWLIEQCPESGAALLDVIRMING